MRLYRVEGFIRLYRVIVVGIVLLGGLGLGFEAQGSLCRGS